MHKELWRDTAGELTPTDQRNIPGHMVSCSACKPGRRRRKGSNSDQWCLSSQVICAGDRSLFSWRWLGICQHVGSGRWIYWCFVLSCTAFAIKIVFVAQCINTSLFSFHFPPPPNNAGEWLAVLSWAASGVKKQQKTALKIKMVCEII